MTGTLIGITFAVRENSLFAPGWRTEKLRIFELMEVRFSREVAWRFERKPWKMAGVSHHQTK